jgi:outer membrane receptor protein involved in Fe transport
MRIRYFWFAVVLLLFGVDELPAQTGLIHGRVIDEATGEEIIGATVLLEGTGLGASTGLDGEYRIANIPPGSYVLAVSMVSYAKKRVTDVHVKGAEPLKLDIGLGSENIEAAEVVIEAQMLLENEALLLKSRQRSAVISDGISAENIARTTSSSAADAIATVTGVTVVDDRYIYLRGLGDRYNTTLLNGVVLPSANPDRNAVSLDLLPARFINNITTEKTFTADKPGDYTGGGVNIQTNSFPERFTLSLSVKTAMNTESTLKDGFLTYAGGRTDWLGMDDGTRAIPDELADPGTLPEFSSTFGNKESALLLDRLTKSFNYNMYPVTKKTPVNHGYGISLGEQTRLFDVPLGYFGSLSYSREFSSYADGISGQYQLTGNVSEVNELTNLYLYSDSRSTDQVLWGGLANVSLRPSHLHNISASFNYSRTGEAEARYLAGSQPRDFPENVTVETRVLSYTERELRALQFSGSHVFPAMAGSEFEWTISTTTSSQDQPDLRYFTNDFTEVDRNGDIDTLYSIRPSNYPVPSRYFRFLDDNNDTYGFTITTPFEKILGAGGKAKFGASLNRKDRTFSERRFEYKATSGARYPGDPSVFFSPEYVGLVDTTNGFSSFGQYLVDASTLQNSYNGNQEISAVFGMVDLNVGSGFRFIAGLRAEYTNLQVASLDTSRQAADLNTDDYLPSASLVYSVTDRMNVRLAYGKTIGRPTFRELAPFASFDFVGDFIFIGNPMLRRTLVDNYDLRWEWFPRPGELAAVSAFLKRFRDPIERAIVSNNNQGQFQNVPSATVVGAEFEIRQKLDVLADALSSFSLQANLTLVHSVVDIPEKELVVLRSLDPGAGDTRPLQGQSPYVLNLSMGYDNTSSGTGVTLSYNIFGKRLAHVSLGGTPNVYEFPRPLLDLVATQSILGPIELRVTVKNLLDSAVKFAHTYKDQEFVVGSYTMGRTVSIGVDYSL